MAILLADFMLASGDAAGGGAIGAVTVCEEAAALRMQMSLATNFG